MPRGGRTKSCPSPRRPPRWHSTLEDALRRGEDVLTLGDEEDDLYRRAVKIVLESEKCSTSFIQRKLQIGYNRAARLVEQMEEEGIVSPANHAGKREVLAG